MAEWWKNHFDLFVWGSLLVGFLFSFLAFLIQKKNNLAKAGKNTHCVVLCTMLGMVKKICDFLQKQCKTSSEDSEQSKDKSILEPKNLSWFVEIIPFILACFASVVLFNLIFVIAEKKKFLIPSPLSYENTFLLVLPLAWTVGIAFFQYRIQDRLTQSQNKEAKLQRQHQRRGEMISALRSLYSCDAFAINFCTHRVSAVSGKDVSYLDCSTNPGYAFQIINRNGDPCFYFPYYQGKDGASPKFTINVQKTGHSDMYPLNDASCCVRPNLIFIYLPLNEVSEVPNYIYSFFLSPFFDEENEVENKIEKLTFSITLEAIDPYDNVTLEDSIENGPFKYQITFDVEPHGGYSSDGMFPVTVRNYSIQEIPCNPSLYR